jgi:hypothetical protein
MTVDPHPPYISLFPRLKIKMKGRHFDTTEVIEAESQAVLNSLTEHDFQGAFRKMAEAPGTLHTSGRELLHGLCRPVGQEFVFDQMAATVPGIMDGSGSNV